MPILKLLYNAEEHNAHHIYMSLIILLILSQDENFNKSVHELVSREEGGTVGGRDGVMEDDWINTTNSLPHDEQCKQSASRRVDTLLLATENSNYSLVHGTSDHEHHTGRAAGAGRAEDDPVQHDKDEGEPIPPSPSPALHC